jgi:hypothetical protein
MREKAYYSLDKDNGYTNGFKGEIEMGKAPTKEQFKVLLKQEIISWDKRINELEGELKEQALDANLKQNGYLVCLRVKPRFRKCRKTVFKWR